MGLYVDETKFLDDLNGRFRDDLPDAMEFSLEEYLEEYPRLNSKDKKDLLEESVIMFKKDLGVKRDDFEFMRNLYLEVPLGVDGDMDYYEVIFQVTSFQDNTIVNQDFSTYIKDVYTDDWVKENSLRLSELIIE